MSGKYSVHGNLAEKMPASRQRKVVVKRRIHARVVLTDISARRKCLAAVLTVIFMAALLVYSAEVAADTGYQLNKVKVTVQKVQSENEQLNLDIAELKSPDRIKNIAMTKLNMVLPTNIYYASQN